MDANKASSRSNVTTLAGMGEFWDTHDFTDYDLLPVRHLTWCTNVHILSL
jgi:hypothetical protein